MGASEQIYRNRHRCVPHLARLKMLDQELAGAPAHSRLVQETTRAANAIMVEANAGYRTALARAGDGSRAAGSQSLLHPRLVRLQAAANDTVAAASRGDAVALRRHVRRFESLTSAIWTVLLSAVVPSQPRARTGRHLAPPSLPHLPADLRTASHLR